MGKNYYRKPKIEELEREIQRVNRKKRITRITINIVCGLSAVVAIAMLIIEKL